MGLELRCPNSLSEFHMLRTVLGPRGAHKRNTKLVLALQEKGRKTHHSVSDTLSGVKVWWW